MNVGNVSLVKKREINCTFTFIMHENKGCGSGHGTLILPLSTGSLGPMNVKGLGLAFSIVPHRTNFVFKPRKMEGPRAYSRHMG